MGRVFSDDGDGTNDREIETGELMKTGKLRHIRQL
jgi:hypothetical protein